MEISKSWIKPHPLKGSIMPSMFIYNLILGTQAKLKFTIEVTGKEAFLFNEELDSVQDILVLHVENGRDHFISVEGTFRKSIFGVPLGELELIDRGLPTPLKHLLDILLIYSPKSILVL